MATQCDGPVCSFTANEDITAYRCVKAGSGRSVEMCEVDDGALGVSQKSVLEGQECPVRMITVDGTFKIEAGEAFADLADLYVDDDGRVVDTDPGAGHIRFQSLEAASAAGSVVECIKSYD